MSKIGKQPIMIPDGITVELTPHEITLKSAKLSKNLPIPRGVRAVLENKELRFELVDNDKQGRSNWGTMRAIVSNVIEGFTKDFEKTLILEGVGFRMTKEGNDLNLSLGFSHPVKYKAPEHITFEVEKNTILKVRGSDKAQVGQVAAEIRAMKKPDPYKGKGFHYSDEIIKRKAGKKAATAGSA